MLLLAAVFPSLAQTAGLSGRVVDASNGAPVAGAIVTLMGQDKSVATGPAGDFLISKALPGEVTVIVVASGYSDGITTAELYNGQTVAVGEISLVSEGDGYYDDQMEMSFDENVLEDEEGTAQSVTALSGAADNIYYNTANYSFSSMFFRQRGMDSQYAKTYINGIDMNDPIRGRFNYSSLGGMTSRAFRNRTNTIGLAAAAYGFGGVNGSSNISTITSEYAPGFNGSVAYTNANYMFRGMVTYSTGINQNGWGLTVSAIGRYADEGQIEGTFYNSFGYFISAEKVFNNQHSLTFTTFGSPTQRAGSSATYQEAYDLVGDNQYNPTWGWYQGEKRASRITETFDPTFLLNWIWKPSDATTVNTGAAFRSVNYSNSALNWYNANDPKPDYYRNLPSNFLDDDGNPTEQSEYVANLWRTDDSYRQINWDRLYTINAMNNYENGLPQNANNQKGSSYILEDRHSNNLQFQLNSVVNHRVNEKISLQAGVNFSYTKASYYKTVRDLMGGQYWLDVDPFSDREITIAPNMLQNDLDNPNRKVGEGDTFGYDYDINAIKASLWLQKTMNLPKWDINYGFDMSFLQFYREGFMRNGRAPENSLGKGQNHTFDNAAFKAGATYKLNGRNYFTVHAQYGTYSPLIENVYISPRIKDDAIANPQSERILSGDISYQWNYRRFRGTITGYWTEMYNSTERTAFYDDNYSTFTNYVLSDVRKTNKGVEIGMAFKVTPSVTLTAAGTYAKYQYKNNPDGTRSFENGMYADTTQTIYLKNFYVGGTPQTAFNFGIDWQAPKNWFFNVNCTYMDDAYVKLSPVYHEAEPDLWKSYPSEEALQAKIEEITDQPKMNDAFVLNASIGKLIYINRKVSMNINVNVDNILNNDEIMSNAFQQGRIDRTNWNMNKYPNKYQYSQGTKVFVNVGIRF
ncbi:MAG: carboxypeptidase regulatory-like domain-containing protein [Muribaculaceae bacterium]